MHSTDYTNTFVEVAEDSPATKGIVPPDKSIRTIAQMQYELISRNPYKYTSDEILFQVYAARNKVRAEDMHLKKAEFFSKTQACLRSSPLGKTYGWGIHYNGKSRIALFGMDTAEYASFTKDKSIKHLKAMRSKRK